MADITDPAPNPAPEPAPEPANKQPPTADLSLKFKEERDKLASELAQYKQTEREAAEAEEAAKRDELAKSGDSEKIKQAYQKKYDKDVTVLKEQNLKLQKLLVARDRSAIVAEAVNEHAMPGKEHLVKLLLKDRVKAELADDGTTKVTIYDEDDKLTADSLKDLIAQLRKDDRNKELFKSMTGRGGISDQEQVDQSRNKLKTQDRLKYNSNPQSKYHQLRTEPIVDKLNRHMAMIRRA